MESRSHTRSYDVASVVAEKAEHLRTLAIALRRRQWEAATNGTAEHLAAAAQARAELMRFWADEASFERFRAWDRANAAGDDRLLARQVRLLHHGFAQGQRDAATIDEMTQLMMQIDRAFTNFRGKVGGRLVSNNVIEQILGEEVRSERRREAWEASKQIGPEVAAAIRQLARLRNRTAAKLDYPNFHRMSLALGEIDPDWLYAMLDALAEQTEGPFGAAKAELDARLAERYRVSVEDLRPWHYGDPFFQRAPKTEIDLDPLFADQRLEDLAARTYDGLGMDVRPVLDRSDLYERERKDQHAFCTDVDREGDVRILCNLQPNARWMNTLLHELGHAVYNSYVPRALPWLLRTYPHILSTEAMAILMGGLATDRAWLIQVRGAPAARVDALAAAIERHQRLDALVFARWVMVMVGFERAFYEDPERDLDTLWWDLVEKYQQIRRPEGRSMPDWATKYHVALAPAYYQNYLLGEMVSIQWGRWLDAHAGGLVDRPAAGDFFRQRVFRPGATVSWNDALEQATGEKLNIGYYVERYLW